MSQNVAEIAASPDGLREYRNAQAWYGDEMACRTDWIHELTAAETDELQRALRVARASGRELHQLERAHFPLDRLAHRFAGLRQEALDGRGFSCCAVSRPNAIRLGKAPPPSGASGFISARPCRRTARVMCSAMSPISGSTMPIPRSAATRPVPVLNYHTDFADLVGLLCLRTPQSGGLSSIASSTTLWNEMLRRRPDLARALLEPVYYYPLGRGRSRPGAVLRHAGVFPLGRADDRDICPERDPQGATHGWTCRG